MINLRKKKCENWQWKGNWRLFGQAANKVSIETQHALENNPWKNIIGLRNKLAHDYGDILAERIWAISKTPIQELLKELEKVEELEEYIKTKRNFA